MHIRSKASLLLFALAVSCSDLKNAGFPDAGSDGPAAGAAGGSVAGRSGGAAGGASGLFDAGLIDAAAGAGGSSARDDAGTGGSGGAAGMGGAPPPACPTTLRCSDDGKSLERCTGGNWSTTMACANGCLNGACNVCQPNAVRCAANTNAVEQCKPDGTGWGSPTTCGAYACTNGACKATCGSTNDCVAVTCVAGKCGGKVGQGESCGGDNECSTGFCAGGICCNARCDGACQTCGTGTCLATPGERPGVCSGIKTCSSNGSCLLKDKQPCNADADCASGACRTYYLDEDGDGYGRKEADKFCGTSAPDGYKTSGTDCCDHDGQAHPNLPSDKYFRLPNACGDYEYDCNGTINVAFGFYNPNNMVDDETSVKPYYPTFRNADCKGPTAAASSPCNPQTLYQEPPPVSACGHVGYNSNECVDIQGTCMVVTTGDGIARRVWCR